MDRATPSGRADGLVESTLAREGAANPRCWLFDFDNTLAALEPEVDWAASRRELEAFLRSEGVGGAIFDQYPKGNLPLYSALFARLRPAGLLSAGGPRSAETLLRRASEIIETYELRGIDRAIPLIGAADLLRLLGGRDVPVVIVTSNSSRTVTNWLKLHRLDDCFSAIVGRDSMLPLKPAPDMIFHALRASAITPSEAAFVGDSLADLHAARAAAIAFHGVAAKPDARQRLIDAGAGEVFASPAALASRFNLTPAPR
jgi:HAD superfamily hydrolase (TIGR01549 family)